MITPTQFWILWDIFVFLILMNFVPTCIAYLTHHPDRQLLGSLNIVSLFSFVLWLALMAWALGGRRSDSRISRFLADKTRRAVFVLGTLGFVAISFGSTLYGLDLI
nr:superinfection immunity protein [Polymorphobacter sp.]